MAVDPKTEALFNLPVVAPPLCNAASCAFVVDYLSKFYKHAESQLGIMNKAELDALRSSLDVLKATAPHEKIDWMPEYGCALLKSRAGCTSGVIALNLIALDLHRFQTTSKRTPDCDRRIDAFDSELDLDPVQTTSKRASNCYSYIDSAVAKDYEVQHVGTCNLDELEDLQHRFQGLLSSAQSRTGDKRSARGGKQGHQRTPAFIHALYREAFGLPDHMPRGGMTDVGLHTGDSQQRDTGPPLVFYSLRHNLHDHEAKGGLSFSADILFKKIVVYLGLYASEAMVDLHAAEKNSNEVNTNAPHVLLEYAFLILRSTSIKAAAFSDEGIDLSFFVRCSRSLRERILKEASSQSALYSQRYELPRNDAEIRGTYRNYSFDLPAPYSPAKDGALSESEIRENTSTNLGWLTVPEGKSLDDVADWVKKSLPTSSRDSLPSMLLLRTVESFIWGHAKELPVMDQADLEKLASIVDNYREVLYKLKESEKYKPLSFVELKSREFLVVWVAFCIIHSNSVKLHETEMEGYGVPLDFNDLSHLVLSSRYEWEVALQVAKYLGKYGTNRPIFSLKDEKSTFDVGRRVADSSPEMVKIWEQEDQDASCRVERHWEEVLRKQELVRSLRTEIAQFKAELSDANRKLAPKMDELNEHELKKYSHGWRPDNNTYDRLSHDACKTSVNSLKRTVQSLDARIASRESNLKSALKAPAPVFQPLPQKKSNAMPIIFFLYMPPIFQLLSRFSFTAQQLRLPHPWTSAWGGNEGSQKFDVTSQVTRGLETCQVSWKEYYNTHQNSQYHSPLQKRHGSDFHLLLRSVSNAVPQEVGPKTVDHIHSQSHGIWYPDELKPRMAWFGGTKTFDQAYSKEINPFVELDHFCLVSNFTERLNARASSLQWTLMQPGDGYILSSRGNLPYARQRTKPSWLSKTQYISFANMRSHPNIQLRNILVAVQERQLPLTEDTVHILIKQSLFHIGGISNIHTSPQLEWKSDLEDHGFCQDTHGILESLCEEIKDSPKDYLCVKLVGLLLNFFSSWEPKCRGTVRKLATSVCKWADDLDREIETSLPSSAPIIRAKQVVFYQHAIMALAGGNLIEADVALMVKMVVKCRNYFTGDNRSDEMQANATDINYGLSQKLDDILQAACQSPTMMTDALRLVFQRCPSSLKWKHWTPDNNAPTQCFQAKDENGQYYTINLITGEVLVNGLPPSRLPLSILNNPLYIRTFGDRNFEVVRKEGFLETCYPIFGRFYRFSQGSRLKIYEFKSDESEMLELLDGTPDGVVWAKDLPERLKIMHSHWLFRNKDLIVLRGIGFEDRSVSFLIQLKPTTWRNIEGQVKCVELDSKKRDGLLALMQKLDTMKKLVLHQSPALDIISKFEPKEYVHSLISPPDSGSQGMLCFFLPRYKLTLELRKNVLHCREIAGYHLMGQQQIDGIFRGISMYLVLEQTCGNGQLTVFPKGLVVKESQGQVRIEVPVDCNKQLLWYQYRFHPRFDYIESKQSRTSRMQLAAIHTATATVLPDELLGMTGEERAITLLRQSFGNRPLSKEECLVLDNIKQLAHGRSPTLSILCHDIELSSKQLVFLHSGHADHNHVKTQCFEGTAYLNNVKTSQISRRSYLTLSEEYRILGFRARRPTLPPRFVKIRKLRPSPITEHNIESLQNRLDEYRSNSIPKRKKPKLYNNSFPLDVNPSSKLELDMMNELKKSWDTYVNSTRCQTSFEKLTAQVFEEIQSDVLLLRRAVQDFSLNALNDDLPEKSAHWHDNAHEMLRIAGIIPTATTADLAKIAIDPSLIGTFNPMLTDESCERLLESILIWLRQCVYEDKLTRLISFFKSGSPEDTMKELDTVTIWNTSKHPYWLVFEVENGIQIRQEQFAVAHHLIQNPGHVIQLNMGLGKTRVILPMLVSHFYFEKENDKVTRLHFLSALFEEGYKYLQNHLTASVLGIKIYSMPFCRDVKLDSASIATMKTAINDCLVDGGALIVAPEHRLSLELKAKELHRKGEEDIAALIEKELIKCDIWRDILDECDDLLHHRYQLIYAVGESVALPGGAHRWRAIQALLAALAQNEELKTYLTSHPKACKSSIKSRAEWPEIQFFDGESLNSMLGDYSEQRSPPLQDGLLPKLADVILDNPPHELKWLQDHCMKDDLKKAIIEKEYRPPYHALPENHFLDILALRGFLAGGVLRHCLLKRHRVDYGVARPGKKRLAVPFRFADTPDLRSEFAHPDCAIEFTVLAYYHDGLTREELMQALKSLMTLGENAKSNFYNSWFAASSDQMKAEDSDSFESLNCITKIDMTNEAQMERLWHFYRLNMFCINYYLNVCVFPNETNQFDSRLTATSWNLAQNPSNSIVGFSGTNDNHHILPLQVQQYFASHESQTCELNRVLKNLDGTNGKMLDMIIKYTLEIRQLGTEAHRFQSIINILCDGAKGSMPLMHAIIDCGALLAGSDLHEISKNILSILPIEEFGGVLFYDDVISQDWVILERSGRLLPKDISPITEKEAFAIYDEPRCRGTDLKLRSKAVALLTLAPKLCKDKLMQAAGRLRRLGQNQKLIIVGGSDVFTKLSDLKQKVNHFSAISTSDLPWGRKQSFETTAVLSWTMKNTVESTAAGFPNWANQGLFFASTFGKNPQLSITEEIVKLEDMYGKSFKEQTAVKLTNNAHVYHMKRTGGGNALHSSVKRVVESIIKRVQEYGGDFTFSAGGCDEECERELEVEIEEEEEVDVEVPSVEPGKETKWDFKKVLLCESPSELPINTKLLSAFIEKSIKPTSLVKITWSRKIYCTDNFAQTILCEADTALNSFLRVVNFVLCFPDGNFVLVSEYEANGLLSLFWKSKDVISGSSYHLLHSSFVRHSLDETNKILLQSSLPKRGVVQNNLLVGRLEAKQITSEHVMASLQLFAGECTFATEARKEALKSMLRIHQTKRTVNFCPRSETNRIVEMRGHEKMFPYSDLEALCEQLLCEF